MTADDKIQSAIVAPAVAKAVRWPVRIIIGLAAAFVVFLGLMAWSIVHQHSQIRDLSSESDANHSAASQLYDQVRQLGAVPVTVPGPQGEPGSVGATGPAGAPGAKGEKGDKGDKGDPGDPGSPGTTGVPGADGKNGENGTDGHDGSDGQSPPCMNTPTQCVGPQGGQGPSGVPGPPGSDGKPPVSWTYTDVLGEHTCTRDSDSPDSAPTYTCRP